MDPDILLSDIRELVSDIIAANYGENEIDVESAAYELAEKFDDLDEWMSSNGLNPFHGGL